MKCEKCGLIDTRGAALQVEQLNIAFSVVPSVSFKETRGEGFRTLFLSSIFSIPMSDLLLGDSEVGTDGKIKQYNEKIVPVLEKLQEKGIVFLGELTPPCGVPLAVTSLWWPTAVFHFVTVKDDGQVEDKVKALGLEAILAEGVIGSVDGKSWFDVA